MMPTAAIIAALLLAAMVLLALEVCTPSFGLLGACGIAALGAAVWQAFTIGPLAGALTVLGILIGTPTYLTLLVRILPRTPLGRRLFLRKAASGTGEAVPDADELRELVGQTGTAETLLRPAGAVRVGGRRLAALSESGLIARGSEVKVIGTSGGNLIVRKVSARNGSGG